MKIRRVEGGWTTEIVVPFQSLRYPPGREQVWGFPVQRIDWKKNEVSYLTPIPPSWGGAGIRKASSAATLVGGEVPARAGFLERKPYVLSSVTTDTLAAPSRSADPSATFGIDARFRLTRSLNADFTYNTDFAQVEADSTRLFRM